MDPAKEPFFIHAQELIKCDQLDVLKTVLHQDFVVNYKHGRHCLFSHTLTCGNLDKVDCLTLLQTAVFYMKVDIVRFILSLGARTDTECLLIAAVKGDIEIFELLLDTGEGDASARDDNGYTAFHYAAMYGNLDVLNILYNRGIQINSQTDFKETPLHLAVRKERLDVVIFLLEKGANVDLVENTGETALCISVELDNYEITEKLIEYKANVNVVTDDDTTPLYIATIADDCRIDIINLLMKHGADANFCTQQGNTPLILACDGMNDIDVAKSLILGKADVNHQNDDGESALYEACSVKGNYDIATALINAEADVNVLTKRDESPLDNAVEACDAMMVRLLIGRGARVDHVPGPGTMLHTAVMTNVDILGQILPMIQDKDALDEEGCTGLMLAARQQWVQGVSMLCDGGARVDIMNDDGMTALHIAANVQANTQVVRYLLERQPNLNSVCTQRTALETALRIDNSTCFGEILLYATNGAVVPDNGTSQRIAVLLSDSLTANADMTHTMLLDELVFLQAQSMQSSPHELTLIHYAIVLKKTMVADHLIQSAIDLNILDINGRSLLYYAVYSLENSILDLILRTRVDGDTHGAHGCEALLTACQIGNVEAVDMLLRYYSGDFALLRAIQIDEVEAVDVLLRRHYSLPQDLRAHVGNSPKTQALLRTACRQLWASNPSSDPGRVGQRDAFADENIRNMILGFSTGLSWQNIEVLRRNYRTQRAQP